MDDSSFRQFLVDAFTNADMVMKPGAVFYIWHADSEGYNFRGACKDAGWTVRECLIWNKNSMVLGRQDYQWKHEPCQKAGTKVLTPNGEVPIEQLKDGDRVVSFDTYSGAVKGYKDGYEIKTANRPYNGELYYVSVGDKTTNGTDNHQFSVRFNENTSNKWCVYLMRKGEWWRVGITRTYDARGFGLKDRFRTEGAEEAWIINVFDDRKQAEIAEQYFACEYSIPYTFWETRNVDGGRTEKEIEWLYGQFDLKKMQKNAERMLTDYGRNIRFPLIDKDSSSCTFSRRVTARIHACNLIPDLMMLPIPYTKYEGVKTFEWMPIDKVKFEHYEGTVYSLAVDKYEHYISDGIVTHNCLYGWKDGAGHLWASDRKQTTVIDMNRPTKADIHPTMKPIALFDYQIKNNTKGGDIVLDLFGGSGTTIMACEQNGRNACVMEYDPRYVDAIINRWETFTGQKAVLLNE